MSFEGFADVNRIRDGLERKEREKCIKKEREILV